MGEGAAKANITIQYCMTLPREVLQSSEIPAVTRIRSDYKGMKSLVWLSMICLYRSSGDYILSEDNWRIGISTLLVSSLGLASFKNVFWSRNYNPGNKFYYECMEVTNNTDPNQPWSLQFRYTGYQNTTKSGLPCLNWFDLNLHWKYPSADLGNAQLKENKLLWDKLLFYFSERDGCRSIPGSSFANGKPFCFVNASLSLPMDSWSWEECDVPVCEVDCARPHVKSDLPLCQEYFEPNPELQATVALMSGGGVGIGDRLDSIDKRLVSSTCRADGRLLSISQPLAVSPIQLKHMAKVI